MNKQYIFPIMLMSLDVGAAIIAAVFGTTAQAVTYTDLSVPAIDSSFKTYMDFRAVTNTASAQYKLLHTWAWCDGAGFMRCTGERDLGIEDDYYCIALGSYYGTVMGTKYRFATDTGNVFYGVLSDAKGASELNGTRQYGIRCKDIVEFLVYTPSLVWYVKQTGSCGAHMPLSGRITKIERMEF